MQIGLPDGRDLRRAGVLLFATAILSCAQPAPRIALPVAPPAPAPQGMQPYWSEQDAKFAGFIRDFRDAAIRAGIAPETYDASMAGLRRIPRVEELNRQQPEFVKPVWEYLATAVSPTRVANGRAMLDRYANMLAATEARYGVPKEILVAVWGLETAYGVEQGAFSMFAALATLAYDGPRQDFARRELIAAMRMEQQQHLDPRLMTSSWAGAFGQTQFVPSSFLKWGVDGDGDGRIDLWHSPADALASAARLLHDAGWQPGQPCYREVTLPRGFAYEQADAETARPLRDWSSAGVKPVRGTDIAGDNTMAAIYLPAGWRGPAFLLFPNFKAVLTYNNAASYALAVCDLADRLRGGGEIQASWPTDERPLSPSERLAMQNDLKALGYDPGPLDGVMGRKARAALRHYQTDHHVPADGYPTQEMLGVLAADLKSRAS